MLTGKEIVGALKKDKKALKELAEIIISDEDIRLGMINALIRDVATKNDVEKAKHELKNYIDARINDLHKRLDSIQKMMQIGFTILGILIALLGILGRV